MTEPRALTAAMVNAQRVADAALSTPDGICIYFRTPAQGSLAHCKHLARSFQQSFSSMRSRARRTVENRAHHSNDGIKLRDIFVRGPYDNLACIREELPEDAGWCITVCPSSTILNQFDIIDIATGKPLSNVGAGRDELNIIMEKALQRPETMTIREYDRALEIDPTFWDAIDDPNSVWLPRPKATAVDLAELAPDIDPFTGKQLPE